MGANTITKATQTVYAGREATRAPNFRCTLILIMVNLLLTASPGKAGTSEELGPYLSELYDEVAEGFSYNGKIYGYGIVQRPVNASPLNPGNNALEIPRYQVEMDFRPNFELNFRRFEFGFSPRLRLWEEWVDRTSLLGETSQKSQFRESSFVNYWLARGRVTDELFVSYGRENLQWGPSALISASNPFNRQNARNNPMLEVPGLDYGRVVWIPSYEWSFSFIANTGRGRMQLSDFHSAYAIKADYTGEGKYFSLIPSYREDGRFRAGYFGGWNITEAVLIYLEGFFSDRSDDYEFLAGGSYTLESGPSITLEYYRNGGGCGNNQITQCVYSTVKPPDPTDPLIRKDYLLLQYVDTEFASDLDLTIREIYNITENSHRVVGILQYELGQEIELFFVGSASTGSKGSEFGSLVDYSLFTGASYAF